MDKLIVAVTILAVSTARAGVVTHVDVGNCPGPGDGSVLDPYCSIQTAIDNAVDTDEIVVAPGTYIETINLLGKAITLRSSDGADVTIIDGQQTGSVVTCASGEGLDTVLEGFTITGGSGTDLPDDQPDYGIVGGGMVNHGSSPTVTGCTFSENTATFGGGMFNTGSDPAITACLFWDNTATGSGMFSVGGGPTVTGCEFSGNTAFAMSNVFSNPTVSDCVFIVDDVAAGIQNYGGSPTITGCEFEMGGIGIRNQMDALPVIDRCTFVGQEQAMVNYGPSGPLVTGCIFEGNESGMVNEYSTPTIVDCTFNANGIGVDNTGGSVVVLGCAFTGNTAGGMTSRSLQPGGEVLVVDTSFVGNSSNAGAGIAGGMSNHFFTSATVLRCVFVGNTTILPATGGGGMHNVSSPRVVIANCLFRENSSAFRGGAVHNATVPNITIDNCAFLSNTADLGAAINNFASSPVMTNCTFAGNIAGAGDAAIHNFTSTNYDCRPSLTNCILWGNRPQEVYDVRGPNPAVTTIRYSTVQGGWNGAGDHNIDADPLFIDPRNGDVRLLPGSPCIDAGHNWLVGGDDADLDGDSNTDELTPFDLSGNPRFADDPATNDTGCGIPVIVDMGAFEFRGNPFPVKLGDINGDGVVGINDFLDLLAAWDACTKTCCLADLDVDGDVGITDFLILLGNWG